MISEENKKNTIIQLSKEIESLKNSHSEELKDLQSKAATNLKELVKQYENDTNVLRTQIKELKSEIDRKE